MLASRFTQAISPHVTCTKTSAQTLPKTQNPFIHLLILVKWFLTFFSFLSAKISIYNLLCNCRGGGGAGNV